MLGLSAGLGSQKTLTLFCHFGFSLAVSSMISSTFVMVSMMVAALTPAKVSDIKSNTSAMPAAKPPCMIYVNSFSLSQATKSDETQSSGGGGRPRLLGALRSDGAILAKVPGALRLNEFQDHRRPRAIARSGSGG